VLHYFESTLFYYTKFYRGGKMTRKVFPFVICALIISGCAKKVDIVSSAIVVNGESISRPKVDQAAEVLRQSIVRAYPQKSLEAIGPVIYKAAAYQLVSNIVMLSEAKKLNIVINPSKIDSSFESIKKRFPDQATFQQQLTLAGQSEESMKKQVADGMQLDSLLKKILKDMDTVKESDCQAFFQNNKDKYVSKTRFKASQMMFPVNDSSSNDKKELARKCASEALQMVKAGKPFDDVIKKFAKNGAVGGDLGFFQLGDLKPALDEALVKMKQGDISDVIATDVGLVILQKTGEEAGMPMPYEQVKDHVKFMLDMKRKNDFVTAYVEKLVKGTKVTYNDTTLVPLADGAMDSLFAR
jgi:parvulin-like peptidyl-prolyl isomerase